MTPPEADSEPPRRLPAIRATMGNRAARARSSLAEAVASLYNDAIDRVLTTPERVTSAAEGRALLASEEGVADVTDRVQRVVVIATPVVRRLAAGARFARVPWVLVTSTTVSVGMVVRTGTRQLQVLGSLIAHRIEDATGQEADPDLVKKLTVEVYLAPQREPDVSDRRLRLSRVVTRWLVDGGFGRETGKRAAKALERAERLMVQRHVARWAELP